MSMLKGFVHPAKIERHAKVRPGTYLSVLVKANTAYRTALQRYLMGIGTKTRDYLR